VESSIQYFVNWGSEKVKIRDFSFSYNYINADLVQPEGVESRFALNSLKNQFIGGVNAEFFKKAELTIKGRYLERIALDPYFLLDARLDYNRLKKFGLFLEISNITNAEYLEAGFVQMPGRWFKAGFMVNLD
jgi:iron complex outermembrane receptor protein